MIEHTQTIYLSVFEHIMGLALKGLIINISLIQVHIVIRMTSFIQKAIFFFQKIDKTIFIWTFWYWKYSQV